jgi:hypothetical protein
MYGLTYVVLQVTPKETDFVTAAIADIMTRGSNWATLAPELTLSVSILNPMRLRISRKNGFHIITKNIFACIGIGKEYAADFAFVSKTGYVDPVVESIFTSRVITVSPDVVQPSKDLRIL